MASERKAKDSTKSKARKSGSRKTGGGSSGGGSSSRSASQSKGSQSRSRRSAAQSKASDSRSQRSASQSNGSDSQSKGSDTRSNSSAEQSRSPTVENGNASRRGLNAAEAVEHARRQLSQLLGRPVESVLGVDRAEGGWVVAAEVLELARVPNTTDVLGEYRATLDRDGELLGFEQRRRYSRGHTTGGDS